MSSITEPQHNSGSAPFFSKEATIAKPGFSRWMVPPAALAVHLCIGQAYAFSVFNGPLTKVIGITQSTADDWSLTSLGWIFSLAIVFLGLSAAFAGKWLEHVGPRRTMFTAACCFGGGFLISALGVYLHQIVLLYLGYGVIGGIGLGLGYVSPVSTLIRWFPDRRGMATGMAIMGFGGGAMIAAPLSVALMNHFRSATSIGVAETFIVLGIVYFISMSIGGPWYRKLGMQVLISLVLGIAVGLIFPKFGAQLKILGDIFLALIKAGVAPLVFLTIVHGIASAGDVKSAGRVGWRSIVYFEIVSTIALAVGLLAGNLDRKSVV